MTRVRGCWPVLAMPLVLIAVVLGSQAPVHAKDCPMILELGGKTKAEIVGIAFTDEVTGVSGNTMKVTGERRKRFRIAVVTLKVTKPRGKKLRLAAADFTLHYYHGEHPEVTPAEGMSTFSTIEDVDRPITLPRMSGPGFTKQVTGIRSTRGDTVYFDIVFGYMEAETKECWICVAQPISSLPYMTRGWVNR